MSRMTQAELDALQSSASEHNQAVASDILDCMDQIEQLSGEMVVVDPNSAQVRDKMAEALRVFRHKFNGEVAPLLGVPLDPPADP